MGREHYSRGSTQVKVTVQRTPTFSLTLNAGKRLNLLLSAQHSRVVFFCSFVRDACSR
mgnify:CR=1 FL=1